MDVSVCIVNWNTRELLYKCIKSIKEKTLGLTYEIIIVDNDSHDGSAEMVRKEFPDCKVTESENVGFARGNNKAAKEATGKYILYLNPDTELVTNALYGMFRFLEDNKDFGAVGCRLIYPNGVIQYTCACTFPTPFNQMCYLLGLNRIFPKSKVFSSSELDYWDHQTSGSVDCLSGACMMVRKSIIERLGGFDESTFMYSEDFDLCYRILKDGWKIYYLSEEVIIHNEGSSTNKKKNKNFAPLMMKESNFYFLSKHFGHAKPKQFRLVTCIGSLSRILSVMLLFPILMPVLNNKEKNFSEVLDKYTNIFLWSIGIRHAENPLKELQR